MPRRPATAAPARMLRAGTAGANSRVWGSRSKRACSGRAQFVLVREEPAVGFLDAFTQADARLPAKAVQAADVEQLARRAVGLAGVVDDRAFEAGDLLHEFGQFADADVVADADVDDVLAVISLR